MSSWQNICFEFDSRVYDLGVRGRYFIVTGIQNRGKNPDFTKIYEEMSRQKLGWITDNAIQNDVVLQGFRDLHAAVGRSNRTYVASPEYLLRSLARHQKLPVINLLVD